MVESPQQIIPLSTSTTLGETTISPCHDGGVEVHNHKLSFKTPPLKENQFVIPNTGQELYTIDKVKTDISQVFDKFLQELHNLILSYGVLELILKNKWLTQLKALPSSSPLTYPEQGIFAQHQPRGPITGLPPLAIEISEHNTTNDRYALCPIGELIQDITTGVAHGEIFPPQWNIQTIQDFISK